jgi:hypothetical protein
LFALWRSAGVHSDLRAMVHALIESFNDTYNKKLSVDNGFKSMPSKRGVA